MTQDRRAEAPVTNIQCLFLISAIIARGPCLALEPRPMVQPPPGTLLMTSTEGKDSHGGSHISH